MSNDEVGGLDFLLEFIGWHRLNDPARKIPFRDGTDLPKYVGIIGQ